MRARFRLILLGLVIVSTARAQSSDLLQRRAAQAWAAQDWAQVAESYATLAKQTPDVALPHMRLGVALIYLGRGTEAKPHLEAAERLGAPVPQAAFRLGQVQASLGNADGAFSELKRATDAGLAVLPVPADTDPVLGRLKADRRFGEFLTAVDRNARPCVHNPRHAEFDFWLGEWEVRPRGQPAVSPSINVITKIHEGCVVLETYTSGTYTGQSFNIYDRTRQQWNQTWVDKMGGLHVYWGEARNGNMYYDGEMPDPTNPSKRVRTRLTFFSFAPDSVRQFSESTRDDGKTWTINYDLMYTRKR